jgi:hypothetical protein
MALIALGSCAADHAASEMATCALLEPPKLADWAAEGLVQMLLACQADRLPTAGGRIIDALDKVVAADEQALILSNDYFKSLPASHAYLLADKWLRSGDNRTLYAADSLGYASATRARQELADCAVQAPEYATTLLSSLALIGGTEAVELLIARVDSPQVGRAAQEALCLCVHDVAGSEFDELVDRLLRGDLRNRWGIFRAIGVCGATRFIPSLTDGLASKGGTERGMAALGLAEFERSRTIPQIRAVLDEATEANEILMAGLALLRLKSTSDVFVRLERAAIDGQAWHCPLPSLSTWSQS